MKRTAKLGVGIVAAFLVAGFALFLPASLAGTHSSTPLQSSGGGLDVNQPVWNTGNLCTPTVTGSGPFVYTCTSYASGENGLGGSAGISAPLWYNFSAGESTGNTYVITLIGSDDCLYLNFHSFDSSIVIYLDGSSYVCPASAAGGPLQPGINIVVNSEGDAFSLIQDGSSYATNITTYGTTVVPVVLQEGSYLYTNVTYIGTSASTCPSGITDGKVAWSVTQIGTNDVFGTIFVDGTNVHVAPPTYDWSTEPMTPLDGTAFGYGLSYGNETTNNLPAGGCSYIVE